MIYLLLYCSTIVLINRQNNVLHCNPLSHQHRIIQYYKITKLLRTDLINLATTLRIVCNDTIIKIYEHYIMFFMIYYTIWICYVIWNKSLNGNILDKRF